MKQIRTACPQDAHAITNLRVREYSRAKDFKLLKPEALRWNAMDEAHTVLTIWNEDDDLIATMRMVRVASMPIAEEVMRSEVPGKVNFPALIFNLAVTRKENRHQGLNQLLRYYCIQLAKTMGIQSLLSPMFQKSPRVKFMKSLGYVCHERNLSWQSTLVPGSPLILCILGQDQFDDALTALEKAIPDLLKDYPWTGPEFRNQTT